MFLDASHLASYLCANSHTIKFIFLYICIMKLSEKIRSLRTEAGLSQEQLGERICVSRQAITKWETGAGVPDISNLVSLSNLFNISVDELLRDEIRQQDPKPYLYETRLRYGLDAQKNLDINIGSALEVLMEGYEGEDLVVSAGSNEIKDLDRLLKIRLDDGKERIDIDSVRKEGLTDTACRELLHVRILIPERCIGHVEFEGKTANLELRNIAGKVELTINADVSITVRSFSGELSVNQVNALSRLFVPEGIPVHFIKKGVKTRIILQDGVQDVPDSDNTIELNGIGSEMTVGALR